MGYRGGIEKTGKENAAFTIRTRTGSCHEPVRDGGAQTPLAIIV